MLKLSSTAQLLFASVGPNPYLWSMAIGVSESLDPQSLIFAIEFLQYSFHAPLYALRNASSH